MRRFKEKMGSLVLALALLAACGQGTASNTGSQGVEAQTRASAATSPVASASAASASVASPAASIEAVTQAAAASTGDLEALDITTPQRIEFWHIQATIYGEAIKEIVQRFNEQNQGKIEVVEVFQGSYGDLNQKIRAAIQGGGLPDIAMAYENDTVEYMKADIVAPLDQFINSPKHGLTEQQVNDLAPAVLARQRVEQYNGATMSWPHGNSAQGVYYNKDVLQQAGIEKPAATWPEFMEQARQIKQATGLPTLAISGPGGIFRNMNRSQGVETYNADGTSTNLDNPVVVESLTMLKTMVDEGLAITVEDTEQEFTNGRVAMEMGTTARTSTKIDLIGDKFDWGITLTPQGEAQSELVTDLYGGNQVMFKKDDPQRMLAAWTFLRYFAGPEAQAIYAAKTGYFPASLSARETPELQQNYQQYPQKQQAFDEVFPAAKLERPSAASNSINKLINDTTLEVLLGRVSPQDAATRMKTEADRLLGELQ